MFSTVPDFIGEVLTSLWSSVSSSVKMGVKYMSPEALANVIFLSSRAYMLLAILNSNRSEFES